MNMTDMCLPPAAVGLLFSSRTKPQPKLPRWCRGTTTPLRVTAPPSVGQSTKTGSVSGARLFTRLATVFIRKCKNCCNWWHNAVTGGEEAEVVEEGEPIPLERLEILGQECWHNVVSALVWGPICVCILFGRHDSCKCLFWVFSGTFSF